ncbi:MAG TPA: M48 family metalloprotease [Burkholderiaceae bacterium]|nr:M48 family metalloprotease [Burkholderiaceae bacterium]
MNTQKPPYSFKKRASTVLPIAVAVLLGFASPSFGNDGDLSLDAERRMGNVAAKQIFRDPDYIDDPLLMSYVDGIWYRLIVAARQRGDISPEMDQQFAWRVMMGKDRSVNAFALPGGYFGLHLGLLGLTDTQDELASVLAHELTHVTQRHISRSISKQEKQTPLLLASLVLGVLAAKNNANLANAVIAGSQAAQIQSQLNYSRDMEREADRIGFNLLQAAGFEPQGFVAMFKLLQQSARLNDNGSYPYLRTHPLNTERIGDMDGRMQNLKPNDVPLANAGIQSDTDMVHKMMAARARVLSEPGADTLRLWANANPAIGSAANTLKANTARVAAVHYAAVLSQIKLKDFSRARVALAKLRTVVAGHTIANHHANLIEMELALAAGDKAMMQKMIAVLSTTSPASSRSQSQNRAELFLISNAQIVNNEANKAASELRSWVASHPQDALAWQLLSTAYQAQTQNIRAIRADAEAQVAVLDYAAALDRFRAAQEMVKGFATSQNRDFIEESIVDVRTRQVQELLKLQRQYEKEAIK